MSDTSDPSGANSAALPSNSNPALTNAEGSTSAATPVATPVDPTANTAGSIVSQTGSRDSGTSNTDNLNAPYSSTNNGTPQINPQELAQQYGWAYSFLTSVPELNTLFNQAVEQQWSSTQFTAALQTTKWFQQNSAAARQAQVSKSIDPYTYSSNVQSETATIQATAAGMGAALSAKTAQMIATQQVTYGWNADQVNQALSQYVKLSATGAFGGIAGQNQMALNQLAAENGISIDPGTMQNIVRNIADSKSTVQDAQAMIRQTAASKYPVYAKQILSGVNLSVLAAQYQHTMQNVLEVGPDATALTSPTITQALQNQDQQGAPTPLSLTQFENNLRAQPQWKSTNNAQDSLMSAGMQVLNDMGLTGQPPAGPTATNAVTSSVSGRAK